MVREYMRCYIWRCRDWLVNPLCSPSLIVLYEIANLDMQGSHKRSESSRTLVSVSYFKVPSESFDYVSWGFIAGPYWPGTHQLLVSIMILRFLWLWECATFLHYLRGDWSTMWAWVQVYMRWSHIPAIATQYLLCHMVCICHEIFSWLSRYSRIWGFLWMSRYTIANLSERSVICIPKMLSLCCFLSMYPSSYGSIYTRKNARAKFLRSSWGFTCQMINGVSWSVVVRMAHWLCGHLMDR